MKQIIKFILALCFLVFSEGSFAITILSSKVKITILSSAPIEAQDFQARCAAAGVIKCVGFDDPSDFSNGSGGLNGAYGFNSGIMPPSDTSDYTRATLDTSLKASGAGSLKFTIPSNSGSDTSGAYFTNFAEDLSLQFDGGQEFFVQWRQRFSSELLAARYLGAGGFKSIIIGTGDEPGITNSSCSSLTIVMTNYAQRGFPILYNSCSGSSSTQGGENPNGTPPYNGFYEAIDGGADFKLQNARPAPFCLYSQQNSSFFTPVGNCFGYVANEWMTFQIQVTIGPRLNDYFKGSYVTLWGAREGQPSALLVKWGPYDLAAGPSGANERFGKVWLLPYNTGKDASEAHPTAYTWYDELIVSRNKIADPK